jgi:hypothetical protein
MHLFVLLGTALAAEPVIDATRVLSLSTAEVMGMGGAGIGFASGANGLFFQPAAAANRKVENKKPFGVSLVFSHIGIAPTTPADLGNLGTKGRWAGAMTNLGLGVVWHNAGMGVVFGSLEYGGADRDIIVTEGHLSASGAFWDGHVAAGAGWRLLSLDARLGDDDVVYTGSGFETGMSLNRMWGGWNLGTAIRTPVVAERAAGELDLPADGVAVPWEIAVGTGWQDADTGVRRPVRVAADLVLDGPVPNGRSLEAALLGDVRTRGADVTVEPHLGVETTVFPERLRWRVGGYVEPARALVGDARVHGTTGLEVRLFHFDLFGLAAADLSWEASVDVAARYVNVAWLGIGFWQRGVVGAGWKPPVQASEIRGGARF